MLSTKPSLDELTGHGGDDGRGTRQICRGAAGLFDFKAETESTGSASTTARELDKGSPGGDDGGR